MIALGTSLAPWPVAPGVTTELGLTIGGFVVICISAFIIICMMAEGELRPSRTVKRGGIFAYGTAILSVAFFGLLVAAPTQNAASERYDVEQAAWTEDLVDWAAAEYGVTAGADELQGGEISIWSGPRHPKATVIAQGEVVDVELRYVGNQAVLMVIGSGDEEQLPRVQAAE